VPKRQDASGQGWVFIIGQWGCSEMDGN